jgi:hypothetical protein
MNEGEIKKVLAVTLTSIAVILISILNMLAPLFGSMIIIFIGIICVSVVAVIYGD